MAQVEVKDYALWTKHVHGDEALRSVLESLEPEQVITLRVAGQQGLWRKMSAYRTSGNPTPGLSPIGPMQARWGEIYRRFKAEGGGLVEIELVDEPGGSGQVGKGRAAEPGVPPGWEQASEAERDAAWEAFKALWNAGWRSERPYGPRDELHERDDG
ncbi:MAG: hypothetical protein KDK07_25675 [Bauldia sp.]|nr:hypothetical protein [Bauldia sp.]